MNPPGLKYSREHEWLRIEPDGTGVIGITEFAAESLGDIVFVELPEAESTLIQFEKFGEIESVKAVSDMYSPINGYVIECNNEVIDRPELVNDDPYLTGWLLKLKLGEDSGIDNLMGVNEYEAFLASQK